MKARKILVGSIIGLALLSFACSPSLQTYNQERPGQQITINRKSTVKKLYGYGNVHLKDLYELKFERTSETYAVPSDLENQINQVNIKVKNRGKFERKIFKIAKKRGYTKDDIKNLSAKESLELIGHIVVDNYDFKEINYPGKAIDEVFETKKAKCSDYTFSVIAIFNIFKEMNLNLKNVYVTNNRFCEKFGHSWNTIIVMGKKDIQIAHMDTVYYENKNSENFNATDVWHLSFIRWQSQFYAALSDYDAAQKELKITTKHVKNPERQELFMEDSAYYYHLDHKYKESIKAYNKITKKFPKSKKIPKYTYYLGWNYYYTEDYENTRGCIELLKNKYKDSSYKLDYLEGKISAL